MRHDYEALVKAASVHDSLDRFLREHSLYVNDVEWAAWVNPNSTETKHSGGQVEAKEQYLAQAFNEAIMKIHLGKGG